MLEGWFFITAALLAASGGAKIRDPQPTGGALAAAGLPSSRLLVTGLGLGEIVAALAGLSGRAAGAWAVAALYAGFTGFVAVALIRRLPIQSCGCFGKVDTPPSVGHLLVNSSATLAAAIVAAQGGASLPASLGGRPGVGIPYLGFILLGVFLLWLLLSELPRLGRKARGLTE
jgi:hypothetical protein